MFNIRISARIWAFNQGKHLWLFMKLNIRSFNTNSVCWEKKTSALVNLTASGIGYTNSLGIVNLRVRNITDNITIGGTNTKIQSLYEDFWGSYSVTSWSCSFSKLMTGLTVGNTYTLRVQGSTTAIYGTNGAAIYTSSYPNNNHLTLSVIQ